MKNIIIGIMAGIIIFVGSMAVGLGQSVNDSNRQLGEAIATINQYHDWSEDIRRDRLQHILNDDGYLPPVSDEYLIKKGWLYSED